MNDGYLGEIRLFAGNFAPVGWVLCEGQELAINQNEALFAVIGSTYGGDGRTTLGVPDLRGRIPVGAGQGPGLTNHSLGSLGGSEVVMLTDATLPPHNHSLMTVEGDGNSDTPSNAVLATSVGTAIIGSAPYSCKNNDYKTDLSNSVEMNDSALVDTGGATPHYNLQAYLGLTYIMCVVGTFPSRH